MDKRKRIKLIVAACFLLVCGTAYLGMHLKNRQMREVVQEKQETQQEPETQEHSASTPEPDMKETEPEDSAPLFYVHICGAVRAEGVYGLPAGSRLIDGITVAGGFADGADTSYHNLAAVLTDGQKVYVPTMEETKELSVQKRAENKETEASEETKAAGTPVNINTAGIEELMTLSGIGKTKAEAILRYREKVGPFQKIEEIKNVSGIGDAMFEQIKDSIVAE